MSVKVSVWKVSAVYKLIQVRFQHAKISVCIFFCAMCVCVRLSLCLFFFGQKKLSKKFFCAKVLCVQRFACLYLLCSQNNFCTKHRYVNISLFVLKKKSLCVKMSVCKSISEHKPRCVRLPASKSCCVSRLLCASFSGSRYVWKMRHKKESKFKCLMSFPLLLMAMMPAGPHKASFWLS